MAAAETRPGAGLLIDADNLSAAAIEQVFTHLAHQGLHVTLRRAYGGHEKLAGMKDCLLRHGIRSLVNHGRGTTDALLVVDAMDLLHAGRLPGVVAIASSDADFAPLALRLREAGIRVVCFAQAGKSADGELARCYDQLVSVDGAAAPASAAAAGRGRAAAAEPAPAPAPPPAAAPAPAPARRTAAARKKARPAPPPPAPADPVRQVLESVDGFLDGRAVELNEVVQRLRHEKLLGKRAGGPAFLKKNAPYVELVPAHQPNRLRLKERAG